MIIRQSKFFLGCFLFKKDGELEVENKGGGGRRWRWWEDGRSWEKVRGEERGWEKVEEGERRKSGKKKDGDRRSPSFFDGFRYIYY